MACLLVVNIGITLCIGLLLCLSPLFVGFIGGIVIYLICNLFVNHCVLITFYLQLDFVLLDLDGSKENKI